MIKSKVLSVDEFRDLSVFVEGHFNACHLQKHRIDEINIQWDRLEAMVLSGDLYPVVGVNEGKLCGYALLLIDTDIFSGAVLGSVLGSYVSPEFRNLGLFKFLLGECEKIAKARNCLGISMSYTTNTIIDVDGYEHKESSYFKEL